MSSPAIKQVSLRLRASEPIPTFLQGSPIWIIEHEELIDGRWHQFTSIRPRNPGETELCPEQEIETPTQPVPSGSDSGL